MKALLVPALAAAGALLASGCAHGPAAATQFEVANPIRHALQPITVSDDLKEASAPLTFEQTLCSRMFAFNKKQVLCSEDVRVILEQKRQAMALGGEEAGLEALLASMDTPRRVNLDATKAGGSVVVTIMVQDKAGATLERFQVMLEPDGADVFERADEAAIKILKVK